MFGDLQSIIEQQYVLAKKVGMPLSDTNRMANFEMEIFVNLLMRDIEEERQSMEKQ